MIYRGALALLFTSRLLSPRFLQGLGRTLGSLLYFMGLSPRRTALENLARAYPDLSLSEREALALSTYRELGAYLGETVLRLHRPDRIDPLPFEPGSRETLEAALAEGRGVLFVSAHLGPWERVAASLVAHGFPLTTIAREAYDPRLRRIYDELREGAGVRSIYRGDSSAPIHLVRTLKRGGLLGVPMDLHSRVPSIDVPFLGVPAKTPVGPARIGLRTRASVVVGTVTPGTPLLLRVTRIETTDLKTGPGDEWELTRRLNEEISMRIRALPTAWVWMHPRWPAPSQENSAPLAGESRYTSARVVDEVR